MFTGRTKTGSFSAEGEVGKGPGRRSHALRGGLVRVRVIGTQQARDRASHTPGHPSCSARQKPTAARGLNLWTNTNRGVYFSLCGEGRDSPPLPLSPEFRWVRRMPSSYKKRVLGSDKMLSGNKSKDGLMPRVRKARKCPQNAAAHVGNLAALFIRLVSYGSE